MVLRDVCRCLILGCGSVAVVVLVLVAYGLIPTSTAIEDPITLFGAALGASGLVAVLD